MGPGRPRLSDAEKQAREEIRHQIVNFPMILRFTVPELQERLQQSDTPAYEAMMISAILHGVKKGDLSEVHRFYERLLGRSRQAPEAEPPERKSLQQEAEDDWGEYYRRHAVTVEVQDPPDAPEPDVEDSAPAEKPGISPGDTTPPE